MQRRLAAIGLAVALALPQTSLAVLYDVPSPYATIAEAVSLASPGDTIRIAEGTHVEPGGVQLTPGLRLIGAGTRNTVSVQIPYLWVWDAPEDETPTLIEGIEFVQSGDTGPFFWNTGNPSSIVRWSRFVAWNYVRVDGGCLFERNEIRHMAPGGFYPLSFSDVGAGLPGDQLTFRYNSVMMSYGGIEYAPEGALEAATFDHNTFVFPGWGDGAFPAFSFFNSEGTTTLLTNNVFWGSDYQCLESSGSGELAFENNCFDPMWSSPSDPCPFEGNGNLEADPLLCDFLYGVDDYRLSPGSPCIGAASDGTNMGALGVGCSAVSVSPGTHGQAIAVRATPNPFGATTVISYEAAEASVSGWSIYDVAGRLVRQLPLGSAPGGSTVSWDGRTDDRRTARPGVYFLRLEVGDRTIVGRLVKVR